MTTANERLRNPAFPRARCTLSAPMPPARAKPAASAAAFALSMLAASGAHAQTPSPLAEWQYSVGIPLEKMYQPNVPDWQIRLGMGATLAPRYDGSERYRPLLGPTVDIRYKDLFFLSTGEGVGVNVAQGRNWRVGIAGTYDLGRRGHDDPEHLNGLGNINPAPEVKLFGEYVVSDQFPLVLRGDVRRNIGGSNGWIGDLGAYMPLPGSNKQFFWFAGPTLTFADSKYMNSWFGVNQNQSMQSGYPQYGASAGLKSVGFGVSMVWFFQKHWFVTADGAVEQLVGSAQHSPIVQKATNAVVDLSFAYQF